MVYLFLDCKFHLTVQNSHNPPHCETSPVSTLSTNISDARRFSLCTAHASQEIVSCKIDVNKSLYNKAGRWRRLWRLDPSGLPAGAGELTLERMLHKVRSTNTEYDNDRYTKKISLTLEISSARMT